MTRLHLLALHVALAACGGSNLHWRLINPTPPPTPDPFAVEADPWGALDALDLERGTPEFQTDSPAVRKYGRRFGALSSVSWAYVRIGRGFAAKSEPDAATRAFWSAIRHSHSALASETERMRVRAAAYAELAQLATERGKPFRAALLQVPSALASVYVDSLDGQRAEAAFNEHFTEVESQLARLETLRRQQADARARADSDRYNRKGSGCVSLIGTMQLVALTQEAARVRVVAENAEEALERDLRDPASAPIGTTLLDQRFLAAEVSHTLAVASDRSPYFQKLAVFAVRQPSLLAAVKAGVASPGSPDVTTNVLLELQRLELEFTRLERCSPAAGTPKTPRR